MGEPYPQVTLPDPHRVMQRQKRDQRQLQRHDQKAHDRRNQQRPPREIHPRQRIGRESRHKNGDDRRRDHHGQRVEERLCHPFGVLLIKQHEIVVLQREIRRCFRIDENPLCPATDLRVIAFPDVGAIDVEGEGLTVAKIDRLSGLIDARFAA